jgi:hypothetical protein
MTSTVFRARLREYQARMRETSLKRTSVRLKYSFYRNTGVVEQTDRRLIIYN